MWYPGEESHLIIFPLLSYFGRSPEEKTTFVLGTYWHTSKYYKRQNLWYIFDHIEDIGYSNSYSFLLGAIHYETSKKTTEWDIAFGIFMDYKGYNNNKNYEFNFLLFLSNWKIDGDYQRSSIMPLWYYEEDLNNWSLLSPIGLSYFSKDESSDFDLGLLGLLYYRNSDINNKSDTRAVLAGSIYWERKKPERGYHSFGSLWGILWDYETESVTGFKKISIMKGLFNRVETKGKVKTKYFWVF